jgi:hypothetical protein
MSGTGTAAPAGSPAPAPAAPLTMTKAQLRTLIQAAVQTAPTAVQPAPQQVPFALVPGGGSDNNPWNFTSGNGLKLFEAATKAFAKEKPRSYNTFSLKSKDVRIHTE